jgi:hypothetical protein
VLSGLLSIAADISDLHDMFMILYLLLNLPWMYLSSINASTSQARRRRYVNSICEADSRWLSFGGFLLMIPPLIWLFYRHAVMKIPGGEPMSRFELMISIHILCLF